MRKVCMRKRGKPGTPMGVRAPRLAAALLVLCLLLLAGCGAGPPALSSSISGGAGAAALPDAEGAYTGAEEVAAYLVAYGELPGNFITKDEAHALGWQGGGLDEYALGASIGGDLFGNYEGRLPEAEGRVYHECDIDTMHKDSRGARRLVFSNDGLIYYTEDHYETFILLYGEE